MIRIAISQAAFEAIARTAVRLRGVHPIARLPQLLSDESSHDGSLRKQAV